jgi:hypothetical protein
MSSRIDALEARRRALLIKCEEQRLELAYRVAQIKPAAQLTAWTRRSADGVGKSPAVWIAVLAALLFIVRRGRLLSSVGWITGLLALASRATTVLRVISQLRAVYLSFKTAREPRRGG